MYKVVSVRDNRYYSAIVGNGRFQHNLELMIEYKIGEFVWPNMPESKIMVFENLECALEFAKDEIDSSWYPFKRERFDIFTCNSLNPKPGTRIAGDKLKYDVENIWLHGPDTCVYTFPAPYGTYFCDAIRINECVKSVRKIP